MFMEIVIKESILIQYRTENAEILANILNHALLL